MYGCVNNFHEFEGVYFAEVDCHDYDDFRNLPQVIEVNETLLGKSAWNSDRNVAYYRSDKTMWRETNV